MREIVFLLEEASAKAMLESLLPRILHKHTVFRCIPFEGKQDLEKQLIRKIKLYQNKQARFIVLRDQDSHPDCRAVKHNLFSLCMQSGKAAQCLVRIACRELEAFYLGDLQAVEQALGINGVARLQNRKKFRAPDSLGSPSMELKRLTNDSYEKSTGSRAIGKHLNTNSNRSPSFCNLITAIQKLETELIREIT